MGLWKCCVAGCYRKVGLCSCNINTDASCATHGVICGKSGQRDLRQSLDRDLVLDQRNLMHSLGWLVGDESNQRDPYGIADKHRHLLADLHRARRQDRSSKYDGDGEGGPGASQRRVRIGERHDGIV